jgi:Domain of unknown function (DUF3854)
MIPILNVEELGREATTTAYSRSGTFLHPHHLRLLLDSGISPEVSRARGYRTITRKSALKGYGFSAGQCRPPALLVPIHDAEGHLNSYQMRPDEPRIDSDHGAVEYEICPGRPIALDAPPACASLLGDPGIPLYITDEVFKADSAASHGLCCIALVGLLPAVDRLEVGRSLNPDAWDGIALDNRLVRFVYDADTNHRTATMSAFTILQELLWWRNAKIQRISL